MAWFKSLAHIIQVVLGIICVIVLIRVAGILFKIIAAVIIVIIVLWLVSQFVKRDD